MHLCRIFMMTKFVKKGNFFKSDANYITHFSFANLDGRLFLFPLRKFLSILAS